MCYLFTNIYGGTMFIDVSKNLKELSKFFPENLYVVGGYVRNKIIGLESGDVDICSSVDLEELTKRLSNSKFSVKVKNLRLGTVLISVGDESFEYTAFRTEEYSEDGSHFPIKVSKTESLEKDALRRDFTINSIYYNVNKDECVDICHGIVDIKDKIIRANVDANKLFGDDAERILRMVRIAGELGFNIEKNTLNGAKKNIEKLKNLENNRKYLELEKILNSDRRYKSLNTNLKKTLRLLNDLCVWESFGLKVKKLKFHNVYKTDTRIFGFLIDVVDNEKPSDIKTFLEDFLKNQFGLTNAMTNKVTNLLMGYYDAISKMNNKEYFEKYYDFWADIYPLLACKSKRLQNRYNFFYQYIQTHKQ